MRAKSPFRLRTPIVLSAFAVLACGLIVAGVSAAHAGSSFKDPYNGGIRLPAGGGEPGRAYTAFINAAYRKDHKGICMVLAGPAQMEQCLEQKQALDSTIAMFTQPKSHKVLGGFMKGEEATLDIAYTHQGAPKTRGFVVMKKTNNRWIVSSTGGSGSGSFSAAASGNADLSRASRAADARGGQPEAGYTGPAYGKWTFSGTDKNGDAWKGTIDIAKPDPERYDTDKYQFHFLLNVKSSKTGRGIDTPCTWQPVKREIACITDIGEYWAVLSPDRKSLTQGKWTELEEDWSTRKKTVTSTGAWSAAFAGGQADAGSPERR